MAINLSRSLLFTALAGIGFAAHADDAIDFRDWDAGGSAPVLSAGDTLTVSDHSVLRSNFGGNPALLDSAWAHAGGTPWWNFYLDGSADVTITVSQADATLAFAPGITVWTSGAEQFNGGTSNHSEVSSAGFNAPHSFNAVGQIGDFGTYWMSDPGMGNMVETLAYGYTGASRDASETGWGETIVQGVNDVSITDLYEQGISGSWGTDANGLSFVTLTFSGMQEGWYTLFVGGTDNDLVKNTLFDMTVSAAPVPEPETWAMLLAGLGLLGLRARRRA